MGEPICTKCGAELIPVPAIAVSVVSPPTKSAPGSEQATAIFGESKDAATTKRLDPRPTTPGYDPGSDSVTSPPPLRRVSPEYSWPKLVTAGI